MSADSDILDMSYEMSDRNEMFLEEAPLLVFRVIGCTVVTLLVGFTIIIYITSGMFHLDCLAQICSEVCIFVAYMLILLTTTEKFRINPGMCFAISFFLHFLFLGAFVFSLLEVLCISQVLVAFFRRNSFLTSKSVFLVGWGCPAFLSVLAASIWHENYVSKKNCWINVYRPMKWTTVIPIGLCASIQMLLLLRIFCISDVPLFIPQSNFRRAKCYLTTRWACTIIIIMLTTSWSCGMMAYNTGQENLFAAFTVSSIVLGVCIFTLRISSDDEVRKIIIEHILCFIVPQNKVRVFSTNSLPEKKIFAEESDIFKNGKIMSSGEANITSHK